MSYYFVVNDINCLIYFMLSFFILSTALTASLRDISDDDDFVIVVSDIKNKKKSSIVDTLLALRYENSRNKLKLIHERWTDRGKRNTIFFSRKLFDNFPKLSELCVSSSHRCLMFQFCWNILERRIIKKIKT